MKAPAKDNPEGVERSAAGIRTALFDAIDGLRAGTIDVKQANAIAKAAETIIKSVDMQVAYERLRQASEVPAVLPAMKLIPPIHGSSK